MSGMERGIEVLAKPIFVRGVSPFYGWRTLRLCWDGVGIEVLVKPIFVRA